MWRRLVIWWWVGIERSCLVSGRDGGHIRFFGDGGGPTEQDRSEGMASLGEAPNERGKSALVTFALFESDSP